VEDEPTGEPSPGALITDTTSCVAKSSNDTAKLQLLPVSKNLPRMIPVMVIEL